MKNFKKNRVFAISLSLSLALLLLTASDASAQTVLSTSLDIGSRGANVTSLQTFLAQDASIYPSRLVTGYYGPLTAAAVTQFQTRYGISAIGRVGPQTRAKINELIASGGFGGGVSTDNSVSKAPYIYNSATSLINPSGNLAGSGVALSWQTDEPARGTVFYSLSPFILTESSSPTQEPGISSAKSIMVDNTYSTSKTINLNDLWTANNSNSYYYMIEAVDANGNISVTWPKTFNSSGVSSQ